MKTVSRKAALAGMFAVCAAVLGAAGTVSAQEVTLRGTVSLPTNNTMNSPFKTMIDEVNGTGAGLVKLRLIGGPEAMPPNEQMSALARGVNDYYYGPTAYYLGEIPEVTAFNGSNKSVMQLREEGHVEWLDQFFNKRVNAKLLGFFGSGYSFHIYLVNPPKRTEDGGVDLRGLKVRGSPSYAAQFEKLGIVRVGISAAEVYTGLERGLLVGTGFPTMGVVDSGWQKFLKYRLFPTFKQGDLAFLVNLDRWNKLSAEQQAFLQAAAERNETAAHEHFVAVSKAESETLKAAGVQDVVLTGEGAKRYLSAFYDTVWDPMEAKVGAELTAEIRKRFYDPALN